MEWTVIVWSSVLILALGYVALRRRPAKAPDVPWPTVFPVDNSKMELTAHECMQLAMACGITSDKCGLPELHRYTLLAIRLARQKASLPPIVRGPPVVEGLHDLSERLKAEERERHLKDVMTRPLEPSERRYSGKDFYQVPYVGY